MDPRVQVSQCHVKLMKLLHLLTRTWSRSPHRPRLPQPSIKYRTDQAAATSICCPAPPRLAPCKPRTHLSTGSPGLARSHPLVLSAPTRLIFPKSSFPDPVPQRRWGRARRDRHISRTEMSSDSSSWARALVQISPYTFSAIACQCTKEHTYARIILSHI